MIRFGTATWNYPGWRGIVYPADQPEKVSSAERLGLYARSGQFETVEADFTFYRPQNAREWSRYAAALPPKFPVVSKVWEEITAETFANVERQKERAGKTNPNFLSAEAFKALVLKPAEEGFGDHLGPFVFEFRKDWRPTQEKKKIFLDRLDSFFGAIPGGHRYAVELRTREYLDDEYAAVLRAHGLAHVVNWWTHMPSIAEQMQTKAATESPFVLARVLLAPGRAYQEAVKLFAPYDEIKDRDEKMRRELIELIRRAQAEGKDASVIVNNRAEGCSPYSVKAIRKMLAEGDPS